MHIDEEDLELYAMQRLHGRALDQTQAHLSTCARCRAKLRETEEYVRALREALSPEASKQDQVN